MSVDIEAVDFVQIGDNYFPSGKKMREQVWRCCFTPSEHFASISWHVTVDDNDNDNDEYDYAHFQELDTQLNVIVLSHLGNRFTPTPDNN